MAEPKKPKADDERQGDDQQLAYFPKPFALVYAGLLVAGVAAAIGVYAVLVSVVPGMADNRAETMKTALLVVGGSGALAALYVSYRKQRTDEHNYLRDQDKLFTERYTAAASQLGNDKAAVRLAGVYALARIADDSKRDRSTCLSVLCSYLRMPYDPDNPEADPAERQVRTTAQDIIADRLRTDHPGFWHDAEVDLNGAHLIDLTFSDVTVGSFTAVGAAFSGLADFDMATFSKDAVFQRARFEVTALFHAATFCGDAAFQEAKFDGPAAFQLAKFNGDAMFGEDALFVAASFSGDAVFKEAQFGGDALFENVRFRRDHPPVWPEGFTEPKDIVWEPAPPPSAVSSPGPATQADHADPTGPE